MSTVSTARSRKRARDNSRDKTVINMDAHSPSTGSGCQGEALTLRGSGGASPTEEPRLRVAEPWLRPVGPGPLATNMLKNELGRKEYMPCYWAGAQAWAQGGRALAPPLIRGTKASPIDVEALESERNMRTRKHPVVLVDLESDKSQGGCDDVVYTLAHCNGSIRRSVPHVICLSPGGEGGASFQASNISQVSEVHTKVAPKEPIFTCSVCLNKLDKPSTTTCGHIFCEECIKASIKAQKKCPTCRKRLGARSYHRVYLPTTAEEDF